MATQVMTLELPVELYDKLQLLAANKRKDPVDMIAHLVTTAYEQAPQASTPAFQSILEHAADLGVTDMAEQHDHYLYGVEKQ